MHINTLKGTLKIHNLQLNADKVRGWRGAGSNISRARQQFNSKHVELSDVCRQNAASLPIER